MPGETEPTVKKPVWKRWWFWLVCLFVLGALGSASGTPSGGASPAASASPSSSASAKPATPQASVPTPSARPVTVTDQLWNAVDSGLHKRDGIAIDYDSDSKVAFISHTDTSPYNAESFVRQAYSILSLWGIPAFRVSGVDAVNVQNRTNFTDQYGHNSLESGVTIDITKDKFDKFDWNNLAFQEVDQRIRDASDVYIVVPAIQSQIKDTSKLYLDPHY